MITKPFPHRTNLQQTTLKTLKAKINNDWIVEQFLLLSQYVQRLSAAYVSKSVITFKFTSFKLKEQKVQQVFTTQIGVQ